MADIAINRENRRYWDFGYTATQLHQAVERKLDYHRRRLIYWEAEKYRSEQNVSAATVEIRKFAQTGGDRIEAVLDPTLTYRLSECQDKIRKHQAAVREFTIWQRAFFREDGDRYFELKPDDIQYFQIDDPSLDEDLLDSDDESV